MRKRPALYFMIALCAGIALSSFIRMPAVIPVLTGVVLAASSVFLSGRKAVSHAALYLAIASLGAVVYSSAISNEKSIIPFLREGEKIFVRGVVADDPVAGRTLYKKDKSSFIFRAGSYRSRDRWQSVDVLMKVYVYGRSARAISYGQVLTMEGVVSYKDGPVNPGLFSYTRYLRIKGVAATLKVREGFALEISRDSGANPLIKAAYKLKHGIRDIIERGFEGTSASFLKAIFIGQRSGMPDAVKDDFIRTGTVHVLSISGLHVGIIALIVFWVFSAVRIPRPVNFGVTLVFLVIYAFAAGGDPPIVRSVIMFAVIAAGYIIGRDSDPLNTLAIAALPILLINPLEMFDPSFQLSFGSIAGIIIFSPRLDAVFRISDVRKKHPAAAISRYLLKAVSVSIAAVVLTWPIVLANFNIISPVAVISNLVIIPMLSFIMMLAAAYIAAAAVFPVPAAMIIPAVNWSLGSFFYLNGLMAKIPFGYFMAGSLCPPALVSYYILTAAVLIPSIPKKIVLISALAAANILVWVPLIYPANRPFEISFLDVGKADAIIVRSPRGETLVIDAGGANDSFDAGRSIVAPYLWNMGVRAIDAVILTHPHADHLGGLLYILKNFKVGAVIDSGLYSDSRMYREYEGLVRRKKIKRITARAPGTITGFFDTQMLVFNPGENPMPGENDNSVVFKLSGKYFSALFPGDVTSRAMEKISDYGDLLRTDVLKVPHHGSGLGKEGPVRGFLEKASPRFAVVTSGISTVGNTQIKEVVSMLKKMKVVCYDTGSAGAVVFTFLKNQLSIKTAYQNNI